MTVKDALREVRSWIEEKTQKTLPEVKEEPERRLLTVWFNAWKYENTNQVWAGLGEAIIEQISGRLPPGDFPRPTRLFR
jgi:hypothetical protein